MLKVTVLGLGLLSGSLFAQDNAQVISGSMTKNYHVAISSNDSLHVGTNDLKVDIVQKAHKLSGMDVNLTLYTPDNKELHYNHVNSSEYFKTDLSTKGEYRYNIKFSSGPGAVSHNSMGSFSL